MIREKFAIHQSFDVSELIHSMLSILRQQLLLDAYKSNPDLLEPAVAHILFKGLDPNPKKRPTLEELSQMAHQAYNQLAAEAARQQAGEQTVVAEPQPQLDVDGQQLVPMHAEAAAEAAREEVEEAIEQLAETKAAAAIADARAEAAAAVAQAEAETERRVAAARAEGAAAARVEARGWIADIQAEAAAAVAREVAAARAAAAAAEEARRLLEQEAAHLREQLLEARAALQGTGRAGSPSSVTAASSSSTSGQDSFDAAQQQLQQVQSALPPIQTKGPVQQPEVFGPTSLATGSQDPGGITPSTPALNPSNNTAAAAATAPDTPVVADGDASGTDLVGRDNSGTATSSSGSSSSSGGVTPPRRCRDSACSYGGALPTPSSSCVVRGGAVSAGQVQGPAGSAAATDPTKGLKV